MGFARDAIQTLEFFADSYLATLAIGLVVSYLGVFVVLKRIVFLGITLAQAAAAGIALVFFVQGHVTPGGMLDDFLENYGPTTSALFVSTAGVAAFALPGEPKRLSREALLGLGYSFFAGASILLVWWSPKGVDELKNLLAGDVLFAREHLTVLLVGLGAVTILHLLFRKEFLLTSYDPDFARTARLPVKVYDVLLALSLGVAVSLALKVAGILLVFAFLAVSPAAGLTLGGRLAHAKVIALCVAASSSLLGWVVATRADLPVSPTVAVFLVLHAAVAAGVSRLRSRWLERAFDLVVGVLALVAIGVAVHVVVRHEPQAVAEGAVPTSSGPTRTALLARYRSSSTPDSIAQSTLEIARVGDAELLRELVQAALGRDEDAREVTLEALAKSGNPASIVGAFEPPLTSPKRDVRLHAAFGLVRLGDVRGMGILLDTIASAEAQPGTREEAVLELMKVYPDGERFGYDPFKGQAENASAVHAWNEWWRAQGAKIPRRQTR